ncbi:LuxR C-terminal-related transcriptional regulator [Pseudomonas sp. A1437]|uniref:LuxR C-terminal-related transcriptional regulator n=1 Tax=unclassified Pseudomonas TaxID=196821 RepID=UPI003783D2E0
MDIVIGNWKGAYGEKFSQRELEAVLHCANNLTVKQVAQKMKISPDTVTKRLMSAKFKIGVSSIRALVLEAFKRQLISPLLIALCAILVGQSATSDNPLSRIRKPGERRAEIRLTVRRAEGYAIA